MNYGEEPTCICMHVHMYNEPQLQFLLGLKLAFLPGSFKAKVYLKFGEGSELGNFRGSVQDTTLCILANVSTLDCS